MTPQEDNGLKVWGGDGKPARTGFLSTLFSIVLTPFRLMAEGLAAIFDSSARSIGASLATTCEICGNQLKNNRYVWSNGDGSVEKVVCTHCNQRLEREKSKQAFRR